MTKQAKLVSNIVVGATPAPAPVGAAKPFTLQIFGQTIAALAQAAVHVRNGYIFSPSVPMDIFPNTGQASITLELGTPEPWAVEAATQTTAEAVELARVRYLADVEQAATRQIEAAKRAETQAQIDALVAKQKEELRALEATVAEAAAGQAAAVAELAAKLK